MGLSCDDLLQGGKQQLPSLLLIHFLSMETLGKGRQLHRHHWPLWNKVFWRTRITEDIWWVNDKGVPMFCHLCISLLDRKRLSATWGKTKGSFSLSLWVLRNAFMTQGKIVPAWKASCWPTACLFPLSLRLNCECPGHGSWIMHDSKRRGTEYRLFTAAIGSLPHPIHISLGSGMQVT